MRKDASSKSVMPRPVILAACFLLFCMHANAQKNPPDVRFELRVGGTKTVFRQGERIPIEMTFSSTSPDTYTVSTRTYDRSGRLNVDQFQISPSTGYADPLADYFGALSVHIGGGLGGISVLKEEPVVVPLELNEWFRFDIPGTYRLRVIASRVSQIPHAEKEDERPVPIRATSNEVTLQIVAADPAWQAQVLQESLSIVDRSVAENQYDPQKAVACRTIRFLGTSAAAREMVRRFAHEDGCGFEWIMGLFGSPNREIVFTEMQEHFTSPWQPITPSFVLYLSRFAFLRDHPELPPPWPENDPEKHNAVRELYQKRAQGLQAEYDKYAERLWKLLPGKRDPARLATIHTLFEISANQQAGALPGIRSQLAAMMAPALASLDPSVLEGVLGYRWKHFAPLGLLPALRQIYEHPPGNDPRGSLRGWAALRILQTSPAEGRTLLLAEMKRLEPRLKIGLLSALSDETLEEFEEGMASHLEEARERGLSEAYVVHCGLVERYATLRVLDRVKKIHADLEKRWDAGTIELLAYFLRVDPAYGLREVAAVAVKPCEGCHRQTLSSIARLHVSPALEGLGLALLNHPSEEIAADAAETLGRYGSLAAKEPLMKRLTQWHKTWSGRQSQMRWVVGKRHPNEAAHRLGEVLRTALLSARSWMLPPVEVEQVRESCLTESCRQQVGYAQQNTSAAHIGVSEFEGRRVWAVGSISLDSWAALIEKLTQFPAGSRWTWSAGQFLAPEENSRLLSELESMAAARGIQLTTTN